MYCMKFSRISTFRCLLVIRNCSEASQCKFDTYRSARPLFYSRIVTTGATMATQSFTNKQGGVSSLKHVRYQQSRQGKVSIPGFIEAQVIGTGHPGTPRSVLINMTHFKYLFNCGEGTQRISMEHRMKVSKIQEIFITRNSWDNIGGLLGMCLSLESMDVPVIRIHGPPNVEKIVTMSKGFAQLHKIRIEKQEADSYQDSAMRIDYITLLPQLTKITEMESAIGEPIVDSPVVAYLCQPHAKERNVSLEKCVELGIERGPMIGQLKQGKEVTLPNGKVIHPDDILCEAEPNEPFLVLECPTIHYLDSLLTSEKIQTSVPRLVIHMTPHSVLLDPRYQSWIKGFPESTTHLVLNESCSGLIYEGVYRIQTMLNMIHDRIFPLLPDPTLLDAKNATFPSCEVMMGETNLKYIIRSKNQGSIARDLCIRLDPEACRKTAEDQDDFLPSLEKVKEKLANHKSQDLASYPELLFLGTGSAIPNKVRNVSAIWLNISEDQAILLDCGENTYGQLIRHYGHQTDDMLAKLVAIFVSHLHADHHLGIISILIERRRVLKSRGLEVTPLNIIAPGRLANWYSSIQELGIEMTDSARVIPVEHFYRYPPKDLDKNRTVKRQICELLNMREIEMVFVIHAQFPHGVILTHKDGWKLVYSGDTRPCDNLIDAGQDCDVLIHEATMEDSLEEEAKAKKHSTTSQAIKVGIDMQAKFILLTHFSQRYAKVPLFNDNFSNRVGIAFDNMRVKLCELTMIPYFLPALKAMFADEYAEMEDRTLKRSYKKKAGNETESEGKPGKKVKQSKNNKDTSTGDSVTKMESENAIADAR